MSCTDYLIRSILTFFLVFVSECLGASRYCSGYYDVYGTYKYGFYCPRLFDSSSERYCCGSSKNKYCCSSSGYYPYYSPYNVVGTAVGVVFGIICLVVVISLVTCCFCATCPLYQRRHRGRVISTRPVMTTTTVSTRPVAYTAASGGQVMMAQPQPPPYAPAYPPPAYNNTVTTTTTNGYGGYAPGYY